MISAVIEPRTAADRQRFGELPASAICRAYSSLGVTADPETGQTLLHGMGELHLTICVETLKEEYNVEATIGAPQVAFREAITRRAVADYTLRKQTGGPGQYARVKLAFEPLAEGEAGLVFEDRTAGGAVPAAFVPGIEKGLRMALAEGGLAGFPVAACGPRFWMAAIMSVIPLRWLSSWQQRLRSSRPTGKHAPCCSNR